MAPWHGCDDPRGDSERCREIFLNHYRDNDPGRLDDDTLTNFSLVDSVSALGGASHRTCQLVGATATVSCLFVDPAAAQGSRAWTSPSYSPKPLSTPFYVLRDGDVERRFWLRDDTGYGTDIGASAAIGSNPRSTLLWSSGPRLCDWTVRKGACDLRPPSWKDWTVLQVSGTYQPFTGDCDGDGRAGVFWYAPGSPAGSPDRMWRWTDSRSVIASDVPVSGTYEPLVGDLDGDGRDDLFLYGAGTYPDHVWYGTASATFEKRSRPVSGVYRLLVGNFDGDAVDDVFWYAPGSPSDSVSYGTAARGFQAVARPVAGEYQPVVGDISGKRHHRHRVVRRRSRRRQRLAGDGSAHVPVRPRSHRRHVRPAPRDMDGSPGDDVFWYRAPTSAYDALWFN